MPASGMRTVCFHPEVEEVLEDNGSDLFALNGYGDATLHRLDLEQKKLTAVMEMAKPECAGEICELGQKSGAV